jgi:hypothetical protein
MDTEDCWIVAETTPSGDPDAVLSAIREGVDERVREQATGATVVAHVTSTYLPDIKRSVRDVADHVDRLLVVTRHNISNGETFSEYFEDTATLDEPTDELQTSPDWIWAQHHFDYYRGKYGINAAV